MKHQKETTSWIRIAGACLLTAALSIGGSFPVPALEKLVQTQPAYAQDILEVTSEDELATKETSATEEASVVKETPAIEESKFIAQSLPEGSYDGPRDTATLVGWGGHVDEQYDVYDEAGDITGQYAVTDVTSNNTNIVSVEEAEDGWEYVARALGTATLTVSYTYGEETGSYTFDVTATDSVYELDTRTASGKYMGLPGTSIELLGAANRCYRGDDGQEHWEHVNDGQLTWTIQEGPATVTETVDGKATVTFNNDTEGAEIVFALLTLTDTDGTTILEQVSMRLVVDNEYYAVEPSDIEDLYVLDVGSSVTVTPQLVHCTKGTDPTEVTGDVSWEWKYDENKLQVSESDGTYTLTRLSPEQFAILLTGSTTDSSASAETGYMIGEKNYEMWLEYDQEAVYTDGTATLTLRQEGGLERIEDQTLGVTVGTWVDEKWEQTLAQGTHYTLGTDSDGKTLVTLDGTKLEEYVGQNLRVEVVAKKGECRLFECDAWMEVREATVDYHEEDWGQDRTMLPGWDDFIDRKQDAWVENSEHPYGNDEEFEITKLEVVADESGQDVVSIEQNDDGWNIQACTYGHALLRATYTELDGTTTNTWNFDVNVSHDVYSVDVQSDAGSERVLPGSTVQLEAIGNHETDQGEPSDAFSYTWSITRGEEWGTLEVDATDSSKATLKLNDMPDGWDSIGECITVEVKMHNGEEEVAGNFIDIWSTSDFFVLYPTDIENPSLCKPVSVTPEVRHYSVNSDSKEGYDVVEGVTYEWNIEGEEDDDVLTIEDEGNGTYTIARNTPGWADVELVATWTEEEESRSENQWYWFTSVDDQHTLTKVAAKAATLSATGNIEHYKCTVCGKLFSDAEGTNEVTQADVTIPKLINIGTATVSNIEDQAYTGKSLTPKPTVKVGGNTLKEGTDYALGYADNVNPGTATITISGKGKYGGTKTVEFKIVTPAASVAYRTHVQNVGNQAWRKDGQISGTSGRSLRLEGIWLKLAAKPVSGSIQYRTHVQNVGWQDWVSDGAMAGTSGRSLRLEAIQIRLTGKMAELYDVYYRVHAQNVGWMGWAKNGAQSGTAAYSYRLEAIQVLVLPKGSSAPSASYEGAIQATSDPFRDREDPDQTTPAVAYRTHVQSDGWQTWRRNGTVAGTSGRSLRLEGINVKLVGYPVSGGIQYRTHVQNIGWQDWVSNGAMSGTSGRSLRLEAIQIRLTGQMANEYDVYYRVHAQNIGWMGWAKNEEQSGTAGYAYRLEAIQVLIVAKGSSAPGATYKGITQVTTQRFRQR